MTSGLELPCQSLSIFSMNGPHMVHAIGTDVPHLIIHGMLIGSDKHTGTVLPPPWESHWRRGMSSP